MEKNKETLRFTSSILNVEYSNSNFSKAKIRVMYAGHNRNGSHMSKETIEKALPTLNGVPIIGYYVDGDFTDHDVDYDYNEETQELEVKTRTVPYGFIPKEAETYWEKVTEYDGKVNDYLVVDGAILWTGRYKEAKILTQEARNHSMEISIVNGHEAVIDRTPTFNVTDFEFTGLCILANTTEPCFESSIITAFNLNEQVGFKKEFENMLFDMEQELNNLEGGTDVAENITNEEVVETKVETTEEAKVDEVVETEFEQAEETAEQPKEEVAEEEFAAEQADGESDVQVEEEPTVEEQKVILHENGIEIKEEALELPVVEIKVDTTDFEAELAEFKAQYEALETEVEDLRAYKFKRESEDLRAKFGSQLTDDEFASILEEATDLAEAEKEAFALIGKKNFSVETVAPKVNKQKLVTVKAEEKSNSPYGDLFN